MRGAVRPEWTCVTPKVPTTMKRVLSALVVSGGIAVMNGAPCSSLAGAPIPEVGGAPLQSIAPVVSRATPGVVGISVRGRVREDNPLLQDPLFRRFFNMQQQPIERETQATGSGVIVDAAQGYVLTNAHVVENASSIEVAVPINMAHQVMDQLIGYGEIRRGRIGVQIQDLTPEIAQALGTRRTQGAVIARVEPGSSAERAGLRTNDLVVAVNGAPMRSGTELRNRVGLARIGEEVQLTVDRGGSERS